MSAQRFLPPLLTPVQGLGRSTLLTLTPHSHRYSWLFSNVNHCFTPFAQTRLKLGSSVYTQGGIPNQGYPPGRYTPPGILTREAYTHPERYTLVVYTSFFPSWEAPWWVLNLSSSRPGRHPGGYYPLFPSWEAPWWVYISLSPVLGGTLVGIIHLSFRSGRHPGGYNTLFLPVPGGPPGGYKPLFLPPWEAPRWV